MEHARPTIRRCAIYTRKSSEEGLEQNFNEACEAFIKSQASCAVERLFENGGGRACY
jgi:site-specific DNA recombinase